MRLADWNLDRLIRLQAACILALTFALFAYEFSRPTFRAKVTRSGGQKRSAMDVEETREVISRLPALSDFYQRKVLVYQVRYRTPQQLQAARILSERVAAAKSLLALNQSEVLVESGGR